MNTDNLVISVNQMDQSIIFTNEDGTKSETYSLHKVPPRDSTIISILEKEMTQGIQIDTIVSNLNNVVQLLLISYNAVGYTTVKPDILKLEHDFMETCGKSTLTIDDMVYDSNKVTKKITQAFDALVSGREKTCIDKLMECNKLASQLADSADELAGEYKTLGDLAETTLEKTQLTQVEYESKVEEYQRQLQEYQAKLDGQLAAQAQINEDLEEVNHEYGEAKKKEDEALKRKHGYEIAGAVVNVLGGVVDMFTPDLGDFGKKEDNSEAKVAAKQQVDKLNGEIASLEIEYNQNQEQQQGLQQNIDALNVKIQDEQTQIETLIASGTSDEASMKQIEDSLNADLALLASTNVELTAAIEAAKMITAKMKSLKEQIDSITTQFEKLSESAVKEADKAAERADKIYEDKIALEKERRECLSDIQEFTVMIESAAEQQNLAATAVETLNMAVKCIKQVVTSLCTASLFWKSISKFCDRLSDSDFVTDMEDVMETVPTEYRISYYYDPDFMLAMLKFMCQWGALNYVCTDYKAAIQDITKKAKKVFEATPDEQTGYDIAVQMSKRLNETVTKQMEAQDVVIDSLTTSKEGL